MNFMCMKITREYFKRREKTNPNDTKAWTASARFEEGANNFDQARKIILRGCGLNPTSEDLWLEAARFHLANVSKEQLWLKPNSTEISKIEVSSSDQKAASLTTSRIETKREIFREALWNIPSSVKLWMAAANSENRGIAKYLLILATECCDENYEDSDEIWLALAKLEDNCKISREILINLRKKNPTERRFWLEIAKHEESNGHRAIFYVHDIIESALISLAGYGVEIVRDDWISEAMEAEKSNSIECCRAIMSAVIGLEIDNAIRIRTWLDIAERCKNDKAYECARVIYDRLLQIFPKKTRLRIAWSRFEAAIGRIPAAQKLIMKGCKMNPHNDWPWFEAARIKNKSSEMNPFSVKMWAEVVKLKIEYGYLEMVEETIDRALIFFADNSVEIVRQDWIQEAINAENEGILKCCLAILKSVIGVYRDSENCDKTWLKNAENCSLAKAYKCANEIYAHLLKNCPEKKEIWLHAFFYHLELYNTNDKLENLFESAASLIQSDQTAIKHLIDAKLNWMLGDFLTSMGCFNEAFQTSPEYRRLSVDIIKKLRTHCAAIHRTFFTKTRMDDLFAELSYADLATLEKIEKFISNSWALNNLRGALSMLNKGVEFFPQYEKFWLMKGHIEMQQNKLEKASQTFDRGVQLHPQSVPMWLAFSELEEKFGNVPEARSLLSIAILQNPESVQLLLALIRLEIRDGNRDIAFMKLAEAQYNNPTLGELCAEAIFMENRYVERQSKAREALIICENDPYVMLAVSKLFFSRGNILKTRKWFNKTVKAHPYFGDAWAYFYKFEMLFGNVKQQKRVMKLCIASEPVHGEEWCRFTKGIETWSYATEDVLREIIKTLTIPN